MLIKKKGASELFNFMKIYDPVENAFVPDSVGNIQRRLDVVFDSSAAFAFQCPACKVSYNEKSKKKKEEIITLQKNNNGLKQLIEELKTMIAEKFDSQNGLSVVQKNTAIGNTASTSKYDQWEAAESKPSQTTVRQNQPTNYDIFVSGFAIGTKPSLSADGLSEKTSLVNGTDFNVTEFGYGKWRTFISFRITTNNETNRDILMDSSLWAPKNIKVCHFIPKPLRMKQTKKLNTANHDQNQHHEKDSRTKMQKQQQSGQQKAPKKPQRDNQRKPQNQNSNKFNPKYNRGYNSRNSRFNQRFPINLPRSKRDYDSDSEFDYEEFREWKEFMRTKSNSRGANFQRRWKRYEPQPFRPSY